MANKIRIPVSILKQIVFDFDWHSKKYLEHKEWVFDTKSGNVLHAKIVQLDPEKTAYKDLPFSIDFEYNPGD